MIVGFLAGYAVRAYISYSRRRRSQRQPILETGERGRQSSDAAARRGRLRV